jgi:hypothetical protein
MTPVGKAWLKLRWANDDPGGIPFQLVERRGVAVFVQEELPARWLEIRMGLIPPGLEVRSEHSRWAAPG